MKLKTAGDTASEQAGLRLSQSPCSCVSATGEGTGDDAVMGLESSATHTFRFQSHLKLCRNQTAPNIPILSAMEEAKGLLGS